MKKIFGIVMGMIMAVSVLGTVMCVTADEAKPVNEEQTAPVMEGAMLGGWQVNAEAAENVLPEKAQAAFDKAMEGLVGMNYIPAAFLGSQVVAGTNYRILCIGTPVIPNPQPGLYVVTVYEDLEGKASVTDIAELDLAAIEETAPEDAQAAQSLPLGGWKVPDTIEAAELKEDAQTAFDEAMGKLLGVKYTPAAVLGTKVIAGTEYAVLCHAVPAAEEPYAYFAAAFIAGHPDGTYELMNIVPLNLAEMTETK